MALVLVVEDELTLAQTIELYLRNEGYKTERATDGLRALEIFNATSPDLVLLDIGLPKMDGLELIQKIRQKSNVPVIMLTARSEEVDELLGLGLGADDYLVKPVSARKLIARVKTVLKRSLVNPQNAEIIRVDSLEINTYSQEACVNRKPLELTPTEFRLLYHLAATPNRAISRSELYDYAMPESNAYERAIDIHLTNLRRKLKEAGLDNIIETVRGIGYRLKDKI